MFERKRHTPIEELLRFDPQGDCIANALANAIRAMKHGVNREDIKIIFVGNNIDHAYLVIGKRSYNQGVTWGNKVYPDMSVKTLERLVENGKAWDITDLLLLTSLVWFK